jgi:hypothetical protein
MIRIGLSLDSKQVIELLAVNAYSILELTLDNRLISKKDLELFVPPEKNEKYRSIKQKLYEKAQSLN